MSKRKKNLKSTIWGGRFEGESSDNLIRFNSSIDFDKNLYAQDIEGSIAHAEMLSKQKIILKKDFLEIKSGLLKIKKEISGEYKKEFNSGWHSIYPSFGRHCKFCNARKRSANACF